MKINKHETPNKHVGWKISLFEQTKYSMVPNNRVGRNKRVGEQISSKSINV